jgi:hypothetical protein
MKKQPSITFEISENENGALSNDIESIFNKMEKMYDFEDESPEDSPIITKASAIPSHGIKSEENNSK